MSPASTSTAVQIENRWRPYPAYQDSGVEWLGEVPEHWKIERLKFNSYIKGRIGWQNLRSDEFTGDGPYLVTGMHFREGTVNWDGCYHITEERYAIAPEIQLKERDVLITKDGSIGKLAYIDYLPGKASLNSHLLVLRPLRYTYRPRFLFYLLDSEIFKHYILKEQKGTTFFGITQESVENFPILIPNDLEQHTIASFLDRETVHIDTLITKKERLIDLLAEKRSALISHAVTKGLDSTVPMKDSSVEWLGEIPAHWIPKKIKHVFRQTKRQNYADLTVLSVYRDYGVIEKDSRDDNHNRTPENLDTYQLVNVGDLVINKMKAWQGSLGMSEYRGITSPDYVVYAPEHGENSRFLHYLLRAEAMADVYRSISNGIRPSQWRLEPENFEKLVIFLPPLSEQARICKFIDVEYRRLEHLITQAQKLISYLNEYRTAIISAAITGKIDVREEVG